MAQNQNLNIQIFSTVYSIFNCATLLTCHIDFLSQTLNFCPKTQQVTQW